MTFSLIAHTTDDMHPRYVVHHPVFNSGLQMEEVDVKYHQFSFLHNSSREMQIESFLVYQNYSGTSKRLWLQYTVLYPHSFDILPDVTFLLSNISPDLRAAR